MNSPPSATPQAEVPVGVRVQLAHAALQTLAADAGVDLLHIKGPAVDPSIGRPLHSSTDADVLVRPDHVARYLDVLTAHGWQHVTSFATGSAFEHAATFYHPAWGYTDVHRTFPGLTRGDAFAVLWRDRGRRLIAGVSCPVPDLVAQRLLLLLHVARNGAGHQDPDYRRAWTAVTEADRRNIRLLARQLGAQVGLAAALGELDAYRDDPSHDLWVVFSSRDASRLDEWRARLKAAPGPAAKARILARSLLVNTDHLAMRVGRRPTRAEIIAEFFGRIREALVELTGRRRP
ncbi:nucleotidyltransferase family protein [Actinomyces sp. MRS3W]|uniref:nucleotidyltransferase family protein n=1 Tax=Actinomyces sp. MRS3W TaxID=2800796 RepID=UPI0028FDB0D9|nr:nucleotidyltransferase family protein [Actinomyces sp. MRS3W]MDU0348877.1 nucleotidyltransferase family protein [Actinomyces sp. MRS3W]